MNFVLEGGFERNNALTLKLTILGSGDRGNYFPRLDSFFVNNVERADATSGKFRGYQNTIGQRSPFAVGLFYKNALKTRIQSRGFSPIYVTS